MVAAPAQPAQPALTALVGADIVPLEGDAARRDFTVIVENGRIADLGPRDSLPVPDGARIIDARGRHLLPGLADMHVHIGFPALLHHGTPDAERLEQEAAEDLALYLANGVTTIRNMSGAPFHLELAAAIDEGRIDGPRLRNTSAILDGSPPVWQFSPVITDEARARAVVHEIKAAGYEAIKVYNHLSAPVYRALCEEGRRVGLPVVGHVPFAVGIFGALDASQKSIEHFRGYDFDPGHPPGASAIPERFGTWLKLTDAQLARYAEATDEAGTWNCPTFVVVDAGVEVADRGLGAVPGTFGFIAPGLRKAIVDGIRTPVFTAEVMRVLGRGKARQFDLLRRLHRGRNLLLVGTDCSVLNIVPGVSIHDELANFVAAGLTPGEALACCCRNPPRFYGEDDWGAVERGFKADLVLLDADPLQDIAHTRRIAGVMAQGRWHDRKALDAGLMAVTTRHPLSSDEEEVVQARMRAGPRARP